MGISAGMVALPLAFGVRSGLGLSAGLYGAIFVCFFAAFFGGTNTQLSGPIAPMTAVNKVLISGIVAVSDGKIYGTLFLGYTSEFQLLANQIPDKASIVTTWMERMPYRDRSGLYAKEDILIDLVNKGRKLLFLGITVNHYICSRELM